MRAHTWWERVNAPRSGEQPWSWPQVVAFRFLLCFWVLEFGLPSPLNAVPAVAEATERAWTWAALQLGQRLGLEVPVHGPSGSGDTLLNWLTVLATLGVAATLTLAWSALQRQPVRHGKLLDFFQLYLRVMLVQVLLSYGVIKLTGQQFPAPGPDRLLTTYADSSPMGLMWTFMGASLPYQQFGGLMEVLAGLLLIFRRTTTLGALLSAGVMANVFAMNLCFDVPVKLLSGQLLLMSLFLAALDGPRLLSALVLNQSTPAADLAFEFWASGRWRWGRHALVSVLMASGLASAVFSAFDEAPSEAGPDSLAGAYDVTRSEGAEGLTRLGFTTWGARLFYADGHTVRLKLAEVPAEHRVTLAPRTGEPGLSASLVRTAGEAPHEFVFTGTWSGTPVVLHVTQRDLSHTRLSSRGFHWVNEFPFNR
jgi:uncharacterized membrane protein YphA (DoxX/SURF4 family)